ncbi:hypothetical protein DL93DRAFT_1900307 [Clavulina sp. PMI_390]|nr:hypothetical protein DL93DRAFT_1900307 [Clavulina sp. PMI_390]
MYFASVPVVFVLSLSTVLAAPAHAPSKVQALDRRLFGFGSSTTTTTTTASSVSEFLSASPSIFYFRLIAVHWNQCPAIPKSTILPGKTSLLDKIKDIVKRELDDPHLNKRLTPGNEFIGWHGTNSDTATLWETTGSVVKPVRDDGSVAGTSGLDAELGPGLYISDTLSVAESAATINAQNNAATGATAKACAIFAKSSTNWRGTVVKAQIPESIRGNAAQFETMRQRYIPLLGLPGDATSPRLGPLTATRNQMLIPEALNPGLEAQCFDVVNLVAQNVPNTIPQISYTSDNILASWLVNKNDESLAAAVKASVVKGC